MNSVAHLASERLLELAHRCVSGALQFDYLSNGAGHHQSTPLWRLRGKFAAETRRIPAEIDRSARGRDIVGRYLAEVAAHQRLSSSEEYRLAVSARHGDVSARRRLIERHLGLVVMMARRYDGRGLPLLDLIEEGNIGLMTAIEKFDPERGWRFSTYAKWWVRQSIELALMTQASLVRVPVHVARALKRRSRGALPYPELRGAPQLLQVAEQDELQAFVDTLAAPEQEQPEWHLELMVRRKHLESALLRLKEIEQIVLRARFGLADDVERTLQDIARELKVSTERVRQIQSEAVGKLRDILQAEHGVGVERLL